MALRSEDPEPLVIHSLGTAAPGSPVHRMQTAVRAGRARIEAVLASQALRDGAAAEDVPQATGEGPQLRRSVPAVGSAAAAGLRPVSDTVRSTYGGVTARAGRGAAPAAAPLGAPARAPVSLIGTLSTNESAVHSGHRMNPADATPAAAAPEPELIVEQEAVIVAPAQAVPAAARTAQKVKPVVVRASRLLTPLKTASILLYARHDGYVMPYAACKRLLADVASDSCLLQYCCSILSTMFQTDGHLLVGMVQVFAVCTCAV